jgi:hypothetical protein
MGLIHLFQSIDPALKPAVIGAFSTFAAAFFGFGGVMLTLAAQGRNSRNSIAETERRKLKAAMYEDALLVSRDMVDAAIELSNGLRIMGLQIRAASEAAEISQNYNLPVARFPALNASYSRFSDASIKIVSLIENRRIIDPRLIIFRTALSSVLHDTRDLMFVKMVSDVMTALPVDNPAGGIFPYSPPIRARAKAISDLAEIFADTLGDAVAYSDDLLVALQNLLLGDLFKKKVSPRRPIAPSKRVITLERAKELEHWFRTSTPWGKQTNQVEAEVSARFQQPQSLPSQLREWIKNRSKRLRTPLPM